MYSPAQPRNVNTTNSLNSDLGNVTELLKAWLCQQRLSFIFEFLFDENNEEDKSVQIVTFNF